MFMMYTILEEQDGSSSDGEGGDFSALRMTDPLHPLLNVDPMI